MRPGKTGKKRRLIMRTVVAVALAVVVTGGFWAARGGLDHPTTQYLGEIIWHSTPLATP